jgi:hypothetical protein
MLSGLTKYASRTKIVIHRIGQNGARMKLSRENGLHILFAIDLQVQL